MIILSFAAFWQHFLLPCTPGKRMDAAAAQEIARAATKKKNGKNKRKDFEDGFGVFFCEDQKNGKKDLTKNVSRDKLSIKLVIAN